MTNPINEARAEVARIKAAITNAEQELQGLDLATHLTAASEALDGAIEQGNEQGISAAAQALHAARIGADAAGSRRLVLDGLLRTLRAALEPAEAQLVLASRALLQAREKRLMAKLDVALKDYQALLDPMVAGHIRLALLANEVWKVRATLVGVKQVNLVSPQSYFALPVPNGSMPNLPVTARLDKMLTREVQLSKPYAPTAMPGMPQQAPAREWTPADRELILGVQREIEEA